MIPIIRGKTIEIVKRLVIRCGVRRDGLKRQNIRNFEGAKNHSVWYSNGGYMTLCI